jgi:hypothetical protein
MTLEDDLEGIHQAIKGLRAMGCDRGKKEHSCQLPDIHDRCRRKGNEPDICERVALCQELVAKIEPLRVQIREMLLLQTDLTNTGPVLPLNEIQSVDVSKAVADTLRSRSQRS